MRVQANIAAAILEAFWGQMLMTASDVIGSLLTEAWATYFDIRSKFLYDGHVRAKN